MLGVTSADKFAAATCGLMYKVTPLLTLALTGTVPKNDFVLGGSFKASDTLSVKAKVGMDNVLEAVANTKIADVRARAPRDAGARRVSDSPSAPTRVNARRPSRWTSARPCR